MKETVGESVARRLSEWGVDTVFGLPGDGINGLMEGFRRLQEKVRFFLVHHEEAAAFMACGYAKATGRIGVCCATSGPGAIHLLNGLYDAKFDHAPVLAITGMQETSVLGTRYQQEVCRRRGAPLLSRGGARAWQGSPRARSDLTGTGRASA
jgi:pyruvate dehydrogenase (quinone)